MTSAFTLLQSLPNYKFLWLDFEITNKNGVKIYGIVKSSPHRRNKLYTDIRKKKYGESSNLFDNVRIFIYEKNSSITVYYELPHDYNLDVYKKEEFDLKYLGNNRNSFDKSYHLIDEYPKMKLENAIFDYTCRNKDELNLNRLPLHIKEKIEKDSRFSIVSMKDFRDKYKSKPRWTITVGIYYKEETFNNTLKLLEKISSKVYTDIDVDETTFTVEDNLIMFLLPITHHQQIGAWDSEIQINENNINELNHNLPYSERFLFWNVIDINKINNWDDYIKKIKRLHNPEFPWYYDPKMEELHEEYIKTKSLKNMMLLVVIKDIDLYHKRCTHHAAFEDGILQFHPEDHFALYNLD